MDNSKVVLIEYINDIQVSVIERGDFFKSYDVEVKGEHEVGFSQTYKYNGLDYCCHCMLSVLVDDGVIEIASYNEEYKRLCETLESIE